MFDVFILTYDITYTDTGYDIHQYQFPWITLKLLYRMSFSGGV